MCSHDLESLLLLDFSEPSPKGLHRKITYKKKTPKKIFVFYFVKKHDFGHKSKYNSKTVVIRFHVFYVVSENEENNI